MLISGVQVIGMRRRRQTTKENTTIPQEALVNCAEHFLKLEDFNRGGRTNVENHLLGI